MYIIKAAHAAQLLDRIAQGFRNHCASDGDSGYEVTFAAATVGYDEPVGGIDSMKIDAWDGAVRVSVAIDFYFQADFGGIIRAVDAALAQLKASLDLRVPGPQNVRPHVGTSPLKEAPR